MFIMSVIEKIKKGNEAKIITPNKKGLLPDLGAGCSLASSITGNM